MARLPPADHDVHVQQQGGLGYLVRFVWMLVGPAVAILSLLLMFQNRHAGLSSADAVLWGAVAACVALRYVDISRLNGLKATGEPATMADWRRYAVVLVIIALALWVFARGSAIFAILKG